MVGRKVSGTDELNDEDEEFRLAIEASLADMQRTTSATPGATDDTDGKTLLTYDLTPRETETILAFSQTIEHASGFGDVGFRRFPHAHSLHQQANELSGKLHRNITEKDTKHRTYTSARSHGVDPLVDTHAPFWSLFSEALAGMHDQLMRAIRRYDTLLTEQSAYTRQNQEAMLRNPQHRNSLHPVYPASSPSGNFAASRYNQAPQYNSTAHPTHDQTWDSSDHNPSSSAAPFHASSMYPSFPSAPYMGHSASGSPLQHTVSPLVPPPTHFSSQQNPYPLETHPNHASTFAPPLPPPQSSSSPTTATAPPQSLHSTYPTEHEVSLPQMPQVPTFPLDHTMHGTVPEQRREPPKEAMLIEL